MYVYIVTNKINGKKYIGLSVNKKPSFRKSYFGSGRLIKQAIEKYGKDNFSKEIIRDFQNENDARKFEKELIETNDAVASPMFYNLAGGGYGGASPGRVLSQLTKDKISKSLSGRKRPGIGEKVRDKLTGRKQDRTIVAKRASAIKSTWEKTSKSERAIRAKKISNALMGIKRKQTTKDKLSKINAKLTKEQVVQIMQLIKNKTKYSIISGMFSISMSCISEIKNRKTYQWVWL